MNQLWQNSGLRDYFGVWSPPAIAALELLNDPGCFRSSWYTAPKLTERLGPPQGYRQAQVTLPPGGYIYAVSQATDSPAATAFQYMVTDLSLNRQLSNAPIEAAALRGGPYYLPDLYPIVAPGLFKIEIWNPATTGGDILTEVTICFVEPRGGNGKR